MRYLGTTRISIHPNSYAWDHTPKLTCMFEVVCGRSTVMSETDCVDYSVFNVVLRQRSTRVLEIQTDK